MNLNRQSLRLRLAAIALFAATGCAAAAAPPANDAPPSRGRAAEPPTLPLRVAPGVVVTRAVFGIISKAGGNDEEFVETTEVPAVEGQVFGWLLEFDDDPGNVRWEERLTLPAKPAGWGGTEEDPDIAISADGRTAVAHGVETPDEGVLSRFMWALADGDPAGNYLLEVAIEGHLVARFRFHVAVPVHAGSMIVLRTRRAATG